jgi:hypothetical protein
VERRRRGRSEVGSWRSRIAAWWWLSPGGGDAMGMGDPFSGCGVRVGSDQIRVVVMGGLLGIVFWGPRQRLLCSL